MPGSRVILGLMSGTSHDGVDAATARIRGTGSSASAELLHSFHLAYPRQLREKVRDSFEGDAGSLCALNFELGRFFAHAALLAIKDSGIRPEAIASHGQTVFHIPASGSFTGSTLQLGEPAVIAALTKIPVIAHFREADIASGGQGAPLVPFADYVLFKGRGNIALQNIGGIANVTAVGPEISEENVPAFDTGPGNCLIDEAARALFGKEMDRGGRLAAKGNPNGPLLKKLMSHPYLRQSPPKSTGRETFGSGLVKKLIRENSSVLPLDFICTLTHFTALSIKDAYERFIFPGHAVSEVVLCGGGAKNITLLSLLKENFRPVKISLIEDYGIPSGAKEALSFAILANETLEGNPSNMPGATGAKKRVILGVIYPPPPTVPAKD